MINLTSAAESNPDVQTAYEGRCHCGALSFVYRTALAPMAWSVRACQCSFCRAHGAFFTSDPGGALCFQAHEAQLLHRYRFGTLTADMLLCQRCGVCVGATMAAGDARFGAINLRALTSSAIGMPAPLPMDYAAEDPGARIDRRSQRWTPLVASV